MRTPRAEGRGEKLSENSQFPFVFPEYLSHGWGEYLSN